MPRKGKQQFIENWESTKIDPLSDSQHANGYDQIEEDEIESEDDRVTMLIPVLIEILSDFTRGEVDQPNYAKTVGCRVIAALWVIDPKYLEGRSLAALSKTTGVRKSKAYLSKLAVEFSDRYGIKNRAMHTKTARESYRIARINAVNASKSDEKTSRRQKTRAGVNNPLRRKSDTFRAKTAQSRASER